MNIGESVVKYRFLIHSLSHTFVVVDISTIGMPTQIYPTTGQVQQVSAFRFRRWNDVQAYLFKSGAEARSINEAAEHVKRTGLAVLTVV